MIALGLVAGSAALLQQARIDVDSLRSMAARAASGLPAVIRAAPDSARAGLTRALALAAGSSTANVRAANLAAARSLAAAYAVAWRDSFFVVQVERFARASPRDQARRVAADSLRRLGGEVLTRDGVVQAMRIWRESLLRSRLSGDSAGMAATLGNLATGFYLEDQLDSAAALCARARAMAERVGDVRTLGNSVGLMANVLRDRGRIAEARVTYASALGLRAKSGDDRGAAADENNLGMVAQSLGDTAGARFAFESALARNRKGGRGTAAARNLTNLATLAEVTGDYRRAARLYDEAIRQHRRAGDRAELGLVLHDLGILDVQRGDYRAAAEALATAAGVLDSTGPVADAIAARSDLAGARAAMGELQPALVEIGRAESLATTTDAPGIRASLTVARADLAVEFNALDVAEHLYMSAASLFGKAGDRDGRRRATEGLATLLIRRGRFVSARALLDTARRYYEDRRDRRGASSTALLVAWAQAGAGDTTGAEATLGAARAGLRSVGDVVGEAEAWRASGELALAGARPARAEDLFRRGLARLGAARAPASQAALTFGLSRALRDRGDLPGAVAGLQRAIATTERGAGRIRVSAQRAAFMADKWEMYADLAAIQRRRGLDADAFGVSERLRARQMLDLLAEGRVGFRDVASDSLAAKEQDLRRRIAKLQHSLEDAPAAVPPILRGSPIARNPNVTVQAELRAAELAYAELTLVLRDRTPGYAGLVAGKTTGAEEVRARLAPDEALLEYLVTDSTTLLFVVTPRAVRAIDLGIGRRPLAAAVDFTRSTLAAAAGDSIELWRPPLQRLYRLLIQPAESTGLLAGISRLVIAPHAELHYLPFAALRSPDTGRFLVERYELAYVPSASLWAALADRPASPARGGALVLAPRPQALPATRGEAEAVTSAFGGSTRVLLGRAATTRALRDAAPAYSVIHLATSAVLNKHNPLFSYLELAPDPFGDGHLDVREVFGLALRARLVVLSACQTALGSGAVADVPAGDDWVGLVGAFLSSGADNVMATLWPVEDRSTARLMRAFYDGRGADYPARSLAAAQRAALGNRATASPAQWAAFVVVGAPR
jgi:CHAT domain-containing protein